MRKALVRSLGPWGERADAVTQAAEIESLDLLEASLRGGEGAMQGGRMMIERMLPARVRALMRALQTNPGPLAEAILRHAADSGLPMIGGWDAPAGIGKIYLNASDASERLRRRARDAVVSRGPEAPHVIGVNVGTAGEELKLYEQQSALPTEAPEALRTWATGAPLAGAVVSIRPTHEGPVHKAWFAALRPGGRGSTERLSGWSNTEAQQLAPFEAGYVTSVGMSADGARWTVYFKPAGEQAFNWRLEPVAVFRSPAGELGVYLEPSALAARAYARTSHHALSYRVREGKPVPEEIDALMSWTLDRVQSAEEAEETADLTGPPAPWTHQHAG